MSRDGWMKKKATASDDNGWAERVSRRTTRSGGTGTLGDNMMALGRINGADVGVVSRPCLCLCL